MNSVSGDVQVRGLTGSANANSVSGDVAITGSVRKATVDTVSGAILVDAAGAVNTINLNTVAGNSTIRLEETLPANYVARSMSGRMLIDGVDRGNSGPTNYTGSTGELAGSFVDVTPTRSRATSPCSVSPSSLRPTTRSGTHDPGRLLSR